LGALPLYNLVPLPILNQIVLIFIELPANVPEESSIYQSESIASWEPDRFFYDATSSFMWLNRDGWPFSGKSLVVYPVPAGRNSRIPSTWSWFSGLKTCYIQSNAANAGFLSLPNPHIKRLIVLGAQLDFYRQRAAFVELMDNCLVWIDGSNNRVLPARRNDGIQVGFSENLELCILDVMNSPEQLDEFRANHPNLRRWERVAPRTKVDIEDLLLLT
jgi:hypothetical protein